MIGAMRIGSLCSGIGGLELGLEWAGLGETIWQVESDRECCEILDRHWPSAQRFSDVRSCGGYAPWSNILEPVDLVCFGFPCQDISSAGSKVGLGGARSGLFYECARIVEELGPSWVIVENVASGAKLWVDACRRELGRCGYASLPIPLSARDVGALHNRARVFLVAHAHGIRKPAFARLAEVARASSVARARASDTHGEQLRIEQQRDSGLVYSVRDARKTVAEFPGWWGAEPRVVRMVHGLSSGVDSSRVAALGNAVVPQCAEVIGWIVRELIESEAA